MKEIKKEEKQEKTVKAIWNGKVIAESNETKQLEGNEYFPPEAVKREFLITSSTHTECGWKGTASYYHIDVEGKLNKDAAWYYPETSDAAAFIKNYIAFWKGVEIIIR
jgi:uncharacterized protein (DUF427 family)